ncbi:MAG: NUDIX hydrolase, partial [Gammaproteobacteria bacterium]
VDLVPPRSACRMRVTSVGVTVAVIAMSAGCAQLETSPSPVVAAATAAQAPAPAAVTLTVRVQQHGSEAPIACARRELKEEAGCVAEVMTPLGGYFTTPGFIDEYIHAFLATGLTRGAPSPEADEFIQPESHTLQGGLRMIDRGEIVDAKTIIALFMADRLIRRG